MGYKKLRTDYGAKADSFATRLDRAINRDMQFKGSLAPHASSYIVEHQAKCTLKKYNFLTDRTNLDIKAYQKFLSINRRLSRFSFSFPTVDRLSRQNSDVGNVLLLAKRYLHLILGDVTWEEIFLNTRHSGGVSMGVPYKDTSIERKFLYPMSTTEKARRVFERYLSFDHRLKEAIDKHNSHTVGPKYSLKTASRATTVPKSNEIDRMIAIEPTVNMFLQQGIMQLMYDRLRSSGLDVATLPERHKQLALEASISSNFATIDFSSASDCVSIALVQFLLPEQWYSCLNTVRCTHMNVNSNDVELSMVSTMGNASTFPVETLVFFAIGVGCEHYLFSKRTGYSGIPWYKKFVKNSNCSVFGDDCIIPTHVSDLFIEVCTKSGFLVNDDKSFTDNSGFRESCGGDYLRGCNVRPFYLKRPPSSSKSAYLPWLYNVANTLISKFIGYFGAKNYLYEKSSLSVIFKEIQKETKHLLVVPSGYPSDSGLHYRDSNRLSVVYNLSYFRPRINKHGSISFLYHRFVYYDSVELCEELRYFTELKNLRSKTEACAPSFPVRQRGGYVVARSPYVPYMT